MKIGFLNLLTLIFVVMKLAAVGVVATWSWWLVFLPTIIAVSIAIFILLFVCIAAALAAD
jgi:hypothetical protein